MMKEKAYWFVFYKDLILMEQQTDGYHIPCEQEPPVKLPIGSNIHYIGKIQGIPCRTYALHTPIPGTEAPTRPMVGLRASYDFLSFKEYTMAGKAFEILNWDQNTRYCPSCGVPTKQISDIGKKCPECRQEFYPHIAPAMRFGHQAGQTHILVPYRSFQDTD